jgi:hypothetical protein
MLAFVPVTLDLYRHVRRHLHWTLQNLVAFADHAGKCWPSVRTLASVTGTPRSTVSRHLAQTGAGGHNHAPATPRRLLRLTIKKAFLPAQRGLSHQRKSAVPRVRTEEKSGKETGALARRFARSGASDFLSTSSFGGGLPDMTSQWRKRIESWATSGGRFWLDSWGEKPGQPGCMVPAEALATTNR